MAAVDGAAQPTQLAATVKPWPGTVVAAVGLSRAFHRRYVAFTLGTQFGEYVCAAWDWDPHRWFGLPREMGCGDGVAAAAATARGDRHGYPGSLRLPNHDPVD